MPKSNREIPAKSNKIKILFIIIAGLMLLLAVKVFYDYKKPTLPESWTVPKIENPNPAKPPELVNQPADTPEISQPAPVSQEEKPSLTPCQQTAEDIKSFYNHLAEQEYIKAYELDEPIADHINKIVIKLLNNPPVVTSETSDFFTLLKNTAHFYRILGPKDLSFVKDILNYENDDIEELMATFYNWSEYSKCQSDINLHLPLAKMYEQASFFLNTLGGQSYLFRRDSKIRILTKYYCVLIAKRAANQHMNKYDIDIIANAVSLIKDIEETDVLDEQNKYIQTLHNIESGNTN